MNNTIVLFTSNFPYRGGEQFLENELPLLSQHFDTVYIVPGNKGVLRSELPRNVKVIDDFNKIRSRKWLYAIKAFLKFNNFKRVAFNLRYLKLKYVWLVNAIMLKDVLIEVIKKENIDLKHTVFYSYWFSYAPLACMLIKRKYDLKFVTRAHRGDLYEEIHKVTKFPFRNEILSKINKVYSISDNGVLHLLNTYPEQFDENRIIISRLGVHGHRKLTLPTSAKPGNFVILSCSNVIPVKRVNLIIDSLAELANLSPNLKIEWYHIGGGALLSEMKVYAQNSLVGNISYTFLGSIDNHKVKEFYLNKYVDIFINVSSSEGIPVSIMEAFSFSVPAIATNVGGTSEIVNNDTGYLVDKDVSSKDIAVILSRFSSDRELQCYKRENAFTHWEANFHSSENYREFIHSLKLI